MNGQMNYQQEHFEISFSISISLYFTLDHSTPKCISNGIFFKIFLGSIRPDPWHAVHTGINLSYTLNPRNKICSCLKMLRSTPVIVQLYQCCRVSIRLQTHSRQGCYENTHYFTWPARQKYSQHGGTPSSLQLHTQPSSNLHMPRHGGEILTYREPIIFQHKTYTTPQNYL